MDANQENELIEYLKEKYPEGSHQPADNMAADINKFLQDKQVSKTEAMNKGNRRSCSPPATKYSNKNDASDDEVSLSGKCQSKSALSARAHREKKKQYVIGLEKSVKELSTDNKRLRTDMRDMERTIGDLKTEVEYLRGVLANQSTLSSLLRNIGQTPGVSFQSSVDDHIDVVSISDDDDFDEGKSNRGIKRKGGHAENIQKKFYKGAHLGRYFLLNV